MYRIQSGRRDYLSTICKLIYFKGWLLLYLLLLKSGA
jgi:hypothetical protein